MTSRIGLLSVDKQELSLGRGLLGLVAVFVAAAFVAAFGYAGIAAVLGALVTAASAGAGPLKTRMVRGTVVALGGSLLTVVGVWSGERGWTAAVVVGLAAFLASLASVYGKEAATASYMLTLWLLLSLTFTASDHSSAALAANFLAGGVLAVALQPLLHRRRVAATEDEPTDGATSSAEERRAHGWIAPVRAELRLDSPVLRFALVRASGIAASVLLGWYLFDAHRYWAGFVAFAITKSDPSDLVVTGVHRAVGTIAGAAVAVELVRNVDSRPWLTVALLLAAASAVVFAKANYAIFTFFSAAVLVLATELVRGDAGLAAQQRIWATLLGVALAFATTAFVLRVARRRTSRSGPGAQRTSP